jgi:molybdopterin molybdotransferase
MLAFEHCQKLILEKVSHLPAVRVPILAALNMVAAHDVKAVCQLPAFDNSAMDGYAIRTADWIPGRELPVVGCIMAGDIAGPQYVTGGAVKIMTGAPLPPGCDAVIPFEEIVVETENGIILPADLQPGQHIRFAGEDVRVGDPLILAGSVVRPAEISMLAAAGVMEVSVYRRVRVAILSTGDELVELGAEIPPGRIINSNSPALAAAVIDAGGEPVLLGIARDDRQSLQDKVTAGLECDLLITSAGVSAGERDLVRDVLLESGVEPVFWKVGLKPGGPTAFGMKGAKPVFALPGNPVSSLLTFEEFVRPALLKMMGHRAVFRPHFKGVLGETVRKKAGKANLLRIKVSREGELFRVGSAGVQQTGLQRTLLAADAVGILPADRTLFNQGEEIVFHFLHDSALLQE